MRRLVRPCSGESGAVSRSSSLSIMKALMRPERRAPASAGRSNSDGRLMLVHSWPGLQDSSTRSLTSPR